MVSTLTADRTIRACVRGTGNSDVRYARWIGSFVRHPLYEDRLLPIIGDERLVRMDAGTGAVKVTPAHDAADYACAQRHSLASVPIICDDGTMAASCGAPLAGRDRFDAREKAVELLVARGLYGGAVDHAMPIARCSRSGDILEPMLRPQWFVRCSGRMAERALEMTERGQIEIVPTSQLRHWRRWLESCHDWCISRQLWWGHRIPAYRIRASNTCDQRLRLLPPAVQGTMQRVDNECAELWIAARNSMEARSKAATLLHSDHATVPGFELEQETDVLDTWFSSAILPLSAFGWPDRAAPDLCRYYPLDILETGSDILFFWVARMAMMCAELSQGDSVPTAPFNRVLLHPLVHDAQGRKMSKSLGNVIDPLHVINGCSYETLLGQLRNSRLDAASLRAAEAQLKSTLPNGIPPCGADALRFALASYLIQGRGIDMDLGRVLLARNLCNKLWNAHRYYRSVVDAAAAMGRRPVPVPRSGSATDRSLSERWLLSRLYALVDACNRNLESFDLGHATAAIYTFVWDELCGTYLELEKPTLSSVLSAERAGAPVRMDFVSALSVLHEALSTLLRLGHPFLPFITEELWQHLAHDTERPPSIMATSYPQSGEYRCWVDSQSEEAMRTVMAVVRAARRMRHLFDIAWEHRDIDLHVTAVGESTATTVARHAALIAQQSRARTVLVQRVAQWDDLVTPPGHISSRAGRIAMVHMSVVHAAPAGPAALLHRLAAKRLRLQDALRKCRVRTDGDTSMPEESRAEAR